MANLHIQAYRICRRGIFESEGDQKAVITNGTESLKIPYMSMRNCAILT